MSTPRKLVTLGIFLKTDMELHNIEGKKVMVPDFPVKNIDHAYYLRGESKF